MEILIIFALILLNGFFALSEIALVSAKRARLEQKRIEGSKGAKIALKLLDDSDNFLSAVQVGITLVGIVTGMYGGVQIAADIAPLFAHVDFLAGYAAEISLILSVVVITYVSIVIGELVPKTIALSNPDKTAIKVAPVIYYFSAAFYPFVKLLSFSTFIVNKLLGIKKQTEQLTEAELRQMIKIASSEGVIEKEQNIIHEKVFNFSDKRALHIMTHRTDVEWMNLNEPENKIREQLNQAHHSKLVCCDGNLDNFSGILHLKDFYRAINSKEKINFRDKITEPLVVPENMEAQNVLALLRQKKTHICCVVNEYGGFEGLITLHDIIENIVGQIPEEGEQTEPDMFVREDHSVLVNGDAPVEILTEIIEDFTIDFEKIDYSTMAGFVFHQLNKIPQTGDKFQFLDYTLEVMDMDGNKTDKILITRIK